MTQLTDEQLNKIKQYEQARKMRDEMDEKVDALKKELEEFLEPGVDYEGQNGTIKIKERTYYNYSPEVENLKDKLSEKKKKEKQEGVAEEEKRRSLYYYAND